eukprot:CAMPEP_0177296528 /NCGR_PEP_ID=MMETSP0368-20130122/2473_1 /TAXON_ID=447022 ORGANISM="Scrippsiella hangoei-like, Strain SHHI-4" /NCGR_SAMPLE_ID=MMETSP0368 /ASSEMBLY_ACC=CAM_ASM_000363 /LENGTH=72 /DNA_ID=CAMNT_0018754665 /DNA_START=266 /DNA_END=481 /DNA_ORIENTATION=-
MTCRKLHQELFTIPWQSIWPFNGASTWQAAEAASKLPTPAFSSDATLDPDTGASQSLFAKDPRQEMRLLEEG